MCIQICHCDTTDVEVVCATATPSANRLPVAFAPGFVRGWNKDVVCSRPATPRFVKDSSGGIDPLTVRLVCEVLSEWLRMILYPNLAPNWVASEMGFQSDWSVIYR